MEKRQKLIKGNYILVNKNQINTRPKTSKERIQELIIQNEETIKKYEKLKEKSNNPLKKTEYVQIISKFRSQQIKLHNKLYRINLFLNMYINKEKNAIPKPRNRFESSNNLYLKQLLHNKANSSLKPNFNYSNIYTNSNSIAFKRSLNRNDNPKYNSCINSIFENKKNAFVNPIKKISLVNNNKKEIITKKYNNNNKNNYSKIFINTSTQIRPNTSTYYHNSELITSSSSKFENNKNKYFIKSIKENDSIYHSKKNIFIINNISNYYNNYYGKIKNNNTKNSNYNQNYSKHIININVKKKIKDKILKYNIIDEDEQLDINFNYDNEEKMLKQRKLNNVFNPNMEFKSNPNLIFRKKFFKIKNKTIVELYYSYHDGNELFIAMSEKSILGYNIKLMKFKNKIFITRLKKHNNIITIIKHFFNKEKMHDYLISGDMDQIVNIWDVSYKYSVNQFLYSIKYKGNNDIYNVFHICTEENLNLNNYLLIYDKSINIYELKEGQFIKNINHYPSKEEKIINLINWKNKDNNLEYIIKCTKHKIIIFNFIDEDIFFELSNYLKNNEDNQNILYYKTEGCIFSNNKIDYLCILSSSMNLEIWDLYNLSLKEKISININNIKDSNLFAIMPWNNRYLLLIDGDNNSFYIIDTILNQINLKLNAHFRNNIRQIYCKKIISKKYGESLLAWCCNRYITLFSSNNFFIKIFDE